MKKILTITFAVLGAGLIGAYFALAETGYQGTSFAAKNLCSGVFVSKLPAETVFRQAVIPASPPLSLVSYNVDTKNSNVSASVIGLYSRTAQYRPGLGCTLVPRDMAVLPPLNFQPVLPGKAPDGTGQLPQNSIDKEVLEAALDYAFAENDSRGNKNTKAVVVMYDGNVIAERYAPGVNAQTPLIGWSMTKSVTNMLTGILVRDGKLDIYAPAPVAEWQNDERRAITINDLLHMSSGLEFNETYGMNTDVSRMLTVKRDTGAYAASKPLIHPPGKFWDYSSGTTNIIARIIQQKAGGTLQDMYSLAQSELFQPLNITAYFEPDPSGVLVGSSYLYMSARDWARLGQLMLDKGMVENEDGSKRQIFTEAWADYSVQPASANKLNEYGAHFWLNLDPDDPTKQRTWPDLPAAAFSMNGYQGQHVLIVPSQQLVVARLGFTPRPARPDMNALVRETIAALKK